MTNTIDFINYEKEFFEAINHARTNPQILIPELQKIKSSFKGMKRKAKEKNTWIITQEGVSAIDEAIEFIKNQKPVDKVELNELLTKAARDHVNDLGPKGLTGHIGSNKSNTSIRVLKYCEWKISIGEIIDYGSDSGIDAVLAFIIDDGVSNRGHRLNLFNTKYKFIGIAAGYHKEYETILVIPMTGGVSEIGNDEEEEEDFEENIIKSNQRHHNTNINQQNLKFPLDPNDLKDLKTGKLASATSTKTRTTITNGKRSSIVEKTTIDYKGKKVVEIIEKDDSGTIIKKTISEEIIDLNNIC